MGFVSFNSNTCLMPGRDFKSLKGVWLSPQLDDIQKTSTLERKREKLSAEEKKNL